jgi:hypothetical protein
MLRGGTDEAGAERGHSRGHHRGDQDQMDESWAGQSRSP